MTALKAGVTVQYMRVGRAVLVERQAPFSDSEWQCWSLRFVTGPKRYREQGEGGRYWIRPADVVAT